VNEKAEIVKTRNTFIVVVAALLVCATAAAAQTTISVPGDYSSIQSAIDAAQDGDVISVSPGTYVENINFLGKAIHLVSTDGPEVTVIDGGLSGSVVTFDTDEGEGSVIEGFTIRNGKGSLNGGGISVRRASPRILGNIIEDNVACDGVGIESYFGSPYIEGNIIRNNSRSGCSGGTGGGGIKIGGSSSAVIKDNIIEFNNSGNGMGGGISLNAAGTPLIEGNIIRFNTNTGYGGGIAMANHSDADIIQNLIYGNDSPQGGGIYWIVPSGKRGPKILNTTIAQNDSDEGSAVFARGFDTNTVVENSLLIAKDGQIAMFCYDYPGETPSLNNNNVFSSGGPAYGGTCPDVTGVDGNISSDPLFVSVGSDDFHIQHGSESIDAGNNTAVGLPSVDLDGGERIIDGDLDGQAIVDLGVFEATEPPPPDTVIGEVGQIMGALTSEPYTVVLENTYSDPVVFAKPLSFNDADQAVVRITDVQSDRFTMYVHEFPGQDGIHDAEDVSYIVLEKGTWELEDGTQLDVGSVMTSAVVGRRLTNSWETIAFSSAFPETPVVISQVQTNNDPDWVGTRQRKASGSTVQLAMESEEVDKTPHGAEVIGWLAIEPGNGSWSGILFEADHTPNRVSHKWYGISYMQDYTSAPRMIASLASYDGKDSSHLRYRNLSVTGVEIKVEEDKTYGSEMVHTTEVVDYLLLESEGILTVPNQ